MVPLELQVVPQVPEAEQWLPFQFPATPWVTAPGDCPSSGGAVDKGSTTLPLSGQAPSGPHNKAGRGVGVAACTRAFEHGGCPASHREPGHFQTQTRALWFPHIFLRET